MPKQKTHKGLRKRVKITATGKVRHKRAGGGHLMSGKNAKRRRRLSSSSIMKSATAKKVRIELGKQIP
ncbi:MAG: 50S ribosomal protein L35 [Phycisphaerae bacterium]